jgi:tetratricopeptide (TPR) repeat protein
MAVAVALAIGGMAGTAHAAKMARTASTMYSGQSPQQAAAALVEAAKSQTENGSWETIGVGRVLYLGGRKADGEAIFKALLDRTQKTSDVYRIALVHIEAKEWAKAKPLLDRMLTMKEHDAGDVVRVARQYVEHGEFARAKPLFERFLAMDDYDEKEAAEIGAYYLLAGDRATAEAWFDRSVRKDPQSVWATVRMAGAYLGVQPQD